MDESKLPRLGNLGSRNPVIFFTSLALGFVVVTFFFPLTGLYAGSTFLLYSYLLYEHHFNTLLIKRTPPHPEGHLPFRDEWVANGGLTRLLPFEAGDRADDEYCMICWEGPNNPSQITLCGHIFCAECIEAWLAKGKRSCPQCTINLWREAPNGSSSELEKLVKLAVAEGMVAIPSTMFTLYTYFTHYIVRGWRQIGILQALLLLGFVLLSALMTFFAGYGLLMMVQQRRTHGVRWWSGGVDSQMELALRMSFMTISGVFGWWLMLMSLLVRSSYWAIPCVAALAWYSRQFLVALWRGHATTRVA